MTNEEQIIDYKFDENEADIIFTKPLYAQGWFICLVWASLLGLLAFAFGINSHTASLLLGLAVLFLVLAPLKFMNSVRKLVVTDNVLHVFTYDPFKPSKQIHFKNMTAVVEASEIYFIRKARYMGGVNLRTIYWHGQWDEIRKTFISEASYVKGASGNFGDDISNISTFPISAQGTRGGGSLIFKVFPIVYELFLLPYMAVCNLLFYKG